MVKIEDNIGGAERGIRIGLGAALIGLGAATHLAKPARIAMGAVGTYGLITGLVHFDPIAQALGHNTYPTAHHPHG